MAMVSAVLVTVHQVTDPMASSRDWRRTRQPHCRRQRPLRTLGSMLLCNMLLLRLGIRGREKDKRQQLERGLLLAYIGR